MTAAAEVRILDRLDWADDGLPSGWPQDQDVPTAGPQVLAWAETVLTQPDGDHAGQPWTWTESQARFVAWWFALDRDGRYLWRRGQIVLPKGAGKSPLAAALACTELAGPVRFAGWDPDGEPMMSAHPSPDVKLTALSQDQASDATLALAAEMLTGPTARGAVPGLDVGLLRVRSRAGKITPGTARAPSKEGLRPTAVILDETHLWLQANGGHRLAESLRRGVAKTGGRSLETTNRWVLGGDSVAERTAEYAAEVRAGRHAGDGVLTWAPVGQCEDLADRGSVLAALADLYADCPWIDIDRLADEVQDKSTHPADARRYYLNQESSSDDAWLRADLWHNCLERGAKLADGDAIVLGFDGSRGRARGNADATALIGCRISDGHLFEVGVWQARQGEEDWEAPEHLIDAAVRDAFKRYTVAAVYCDPSGWQARIGEWERLHSRRIKVRASDAHPFHWWVNRGSLMLKALQAFEEAVSNGDLTHDGSYALTSHVLNARRVLSNRTVQIGKEYPDSPNKIDAAVAAVLAWQARLDAQAKGIGKRTDRAVFL